MEDQIKATIASANNHVLQAYNKLEELGATMPEHKNIENLRDTLYTLPLNVPKVTVTFDTGEGDPVVEEVFPGQPVAKPADPTKEGCFFLGWHKQAGGGYDPENPTLAGLQAAMAAGDYNAFPAGTEIPDTWNGNNSPLIVAQYLDSSNNESYGGAVGAILIRKYVEPTEQVFGSSIDYANSTIRNYLNTQYYSNCSEELKGVISQISIPYHWGIAGNVNNIMQLSDNFWFLLSAYEVCNVGAGAGTYEGIMWDYWKEKTGLTEPDSIGNSKSGRILKTRDGVAWSTWLRSYNSTAAYPLVISTNGAVGGGVQSTQSNGVLPACFIPKPSSSSTHSNAITAQEYNDKNITAQAYNAKSITAHDYNTNAKGVL